MNKELLQLLRNHYDCDICTDKDKCLYGEGCERAFDAAYCTADGFADGVKQTLTYLAGIPFDRAINVIVSANRNILTDKNK